MQDTPWPDTAKVSNQRVLQSLRKQVLRYDTTEGYGHLPPVHHQSQMFSVSPTPTNEGA